MTANITCGLTRAELDAHPTWITLEGSCVALRPDGTKCNCPYSAHFAPQAIQPGNFPAPLNFELLNHHHNISSYNEYFLYGSFNKRW